MRQVIGEEPTAEFDSKIFFKYGCKVVQAALTETAIAAIRVELQLLHFQSLYPDLTPPDEILECLTIQNKDRIMEKVNRS